jgi:iron(III) transport system permease protein
VRTTGRGRWRWGPLLGVAMLVVLVFYPLSMLLAQIVLPRLFAVNPSLELSLGPVWAALRDPGNLEAILDSVEIALGGTVVAAAVGVTVAVAHAHAAARWWRTALDLFVWAVLFTPSHIIAQGWVVLMEDGGALAQVFHLAPGWSNWFFTPAGLTVVMGLKYFPFVYLAMRQALENLGREYALAARLMGAGRRRVRLRTPRTRPRCCRRSRAAPRSPRSGGRPRRRP